MTLVERLKKHFEASSNVLITGAHGVGKTSIIKQVFEDYGLVLNESWLYFSGSTLDPWVDFIGIPKEVEYNGKKCIEIIPPKILSDESKIQAIFIDEFNRSPSKIRNALLELCQFKSINGRKFPNLKVVWAAINPEDEENTYDVERLDPAQKDRFPGNQIFVPYACDTDYFVKKYGKDIATTSINWWNDLPSGIKKHISPRRLDYALEFMSKGVPLEDILPKDSNINKLRQDLTNGPVDKKLSKLYETKNIKEAKLFLNVENNYNSSIKIISSNPEYIKFFVPLLKKEKLSILIADENLNLSDYILSNKETCQEFKEVVEQILTANTNPKALIKIRSYFANKEQEPQNQIKSYIRDPKTNIEYIKILDNSKSAKESMDIVMKHFPDDPDQIAAEMTINFICEFVSTKWEATVRQYDLNLLVKIWNKCYDVSDTKINKLSKEFVRKCNSMSISTQMKGLTL